MAIAFVAAIVTNPASAEGLLVAAPLVIPIIKGGNPKSVEDLDQEAKDVLATIQKGINDALSAIDLKNETPEEVEKAIDGIVSDALDELKAKDKNGVFAGIIKDFPVIRESLKNVALEIEKLKKGDGLQFGQKSSV
jgi:hypothetical protein